MVEAQCEAACAGLNNAHLCTSTELMRTIGLGQPISDDGFYSLGQVVREGGVVVSNDCGGWTQTAGSGPYWDSSAQRPTFAPCNSTPSQFLCCQ